MTLNECLLYLFMLIHVSDAFQLNITSVSYPPWNETRTNCPGLVVEYNADFLLANGTSIKLNYNGVKGFSNRTVQYTCENQGFRGTCRIRALLSNNKNVTITILLDFNNGSKQLLGEKRNFIVHIEEVRGPFQIFATDITKHSFIVRWYRPWLKHCGIFYLNYEGIQEKCISNSNVSCGKTEFEPVDDLCSVSNKDDQVYECSRTIDKLQPASIYKYRIRYNLDSYRKYWSSWSNTITVQTHSEVPTKSPVIKCESKHKAVLVTWEKPPSQANAKIDFFNITAGTERIFTIFVDGVSYSKRIRTTKTVTISVQSCSNSGCSADITGRNVCTKGPTIYDWVYVVAGFGALLLIIVIVVSIVYCYKRHLWCFALNISEIDIISPRFNSIMSTASEIALTSMEINDNEPTPSDQPAVGYISSET